MCALYAFLRHTDDLADEAGSAERKAEAINSWRIEFDGALEGRECDWPGLPAVADTIARHRIPAHLLREVIEGVSMDIESAPMPRRSWIWRRLAIGSRRLLACAACTSGGIDQRTGAWKSSPKNVVSHCSSPTSFATC